MKYTSIKIGMLIGVILALAFYGFASELYDVDTGKDHQFYVHWSDFINGTPISGGECQLNLYFPEDNSTLLDSVSGNEIGSEGTYRFNVSAETLALIGPWRAYVECNTTARRGEAAMLFNVEGDAGMVVVNYTKIADEVWKYGYCG